MAKEIKKFKLSDLTITVPDNGQWEGMETYPYAPIKESLLSKGYKPAEYNYICADTDGNVMYGSRRVWLMKKDMSMDQSTEVDCEIMTKSELYAELNKRLNDDMKDLLATKDENGDLVPPKKSTTNIEGGVSNLMKHHKKKANIAGYPYDYKVDGKVVDAGKS
jgi:hypothetical protein